MTMYFAPIHYWGCNMYLMESMNRHRISVAWEICGHKLRDLNVL